jgi:hypothetical protein
MSGLKNYLLSVYQHENPGNPSDPGIGFSVYWLPARNDGTTINPLPGAVAQPMPVSEIQNILPGAVNPFATLAGAQEFITAAQAYYAAQNAQVVSPATDTLVFGPLAVG